MNTALPNPPDDLDRLFSDFFKAQLKHPWPDAPRPTSGAARAAAEPSELAAARAAGAPRNTPAPARTAQGRDRRDNTARARFTLAASVALMLGTCWYLSNGFEPGPRPMPTAPQNGPNMLREAGADGSKHVPLEQIQKDKAIGVIGPKIDMDEIK